MIKYKSKKEIKRTIQNIDILRGYTVEQLRIQRCPSMVQTYYQFDFILQFVAFYFKENYDNYEASPMKVLLKVEYNKKKMANRGNAYGVDKQQSEWHKFEPPDFLEDFEIQKWKTEDYKEDIFGCSIIL
jgi:hypothetical protein